MLLEEPVDVQNVIILDSPHQLFQSELLPLILQLELDSFYLIFPFCFS